jgi:hypothetical protein
MVYKVPPITGGTFILERNVKAKKPELGDKCNVARIEFEDGKFVVSFADSVDHLDF